MGMSMQTGMSMRTASSLCALIGVALVAVILARWGFSWWSLVLAVIALGCLVSALYTWWLSQRIAASVDADVPYTSGMTMGWAAPFYERYCPLIGLGARFRRMTLRHAGLQMGEQVLDVGCGTGVLTRTIAEVVGIDGVVHGIDAAPAMVAVARREAEKSGNRAQFQVAAIEALPFEMASFDVVFSSLMLHHLPPEAKRQGLREVWRVLRDGGRLIVVDVDRPALPWWLLIWPLLFMPPVAPNLRGEIMDYLHQAGFKNIGTRGRWGGLLTFWVAYRMAGVQA
jgi:ubiquinone/menaquinone biosynthesis C-methylase UbiE